MKNLLRSSVLLLYVMAISSCAEKAEKKTEASGEEDAVFIVNFEDKPAFEEYLALNLDDTHPNLLIPENSEADHAAVLKSWSDLHQRIGSYLAENNFSWGVEDSSITMLQKIYFEPNGEIKTYFFRIFNENVSEETKAEFASLLRDFAVDNRIEIQRDGNFAQCGKTRYLTN